MPPVGSVAVGRAPDGERTAHGEGVHVMENTWELVEIEESDFDVLGNKSY